jgi:hypothetical protein
MPAAGVRADDNGATGLLAAMDAAVTRAHG